MPRLAAEGREIVGAPASVASTSNSSPPSKAAKAFFARKIGSGHLSPFTSNTCRAMPYPPEKAADYTLQCYNPPHFPPQQEPA